MTVRKEYSQISTCPDCNGSGLKIEKKEMSIKRVEVKGKNGAFMTLNFNKPEVKVYLRSKEGSKARRVGDLSKYFQSMNVSMDGYGNILSGGQIEIYVPLTEILIPGEAFFIIHFKGINVRLDRQTLYTDSMSRGIDKILGRHITIYL